MQQGPYPNDRITRSKLWCHPFFWSVVFLRVAVSRKYTRILPAQVTGKCAPIIHLKCLLYVPYNSTYAKHTRANYLGVCTNWSMVVLFRLRRRRRPGCRFSCWRESCWCESSLACGFESARARREGAKCCWCSLFAVLVVASKPVRNVSCTGSLWGTVGAQIRNTHSATHHVVNAHYTLPQHRTTRTDWNNSRTHTRRRKPAHARSFSPTIPRANLCMYAHICTYIRNGYIFMNRVSHAGLMGFS